MKPKTSHSIGRGRPISHVAWGSLLLFGSAGVSQLNRQIISAPSTLDKAAKSGRYERERIDPPRRGSILAADGQVLAQSREQYQLSLNLKRVPHTTSFATAIGEAAGVSASEIMMAIGAGQSRIAWTDVLSPSQAKNIRSVTEKYRADGVSLDPHIVRDYPQGYAVASILGTYGIGKENGGIEKSLNEALEGLPGKRVGLVDRTGAFLPARMSAKSTERIDGSDVTLTLDSSLQSAVTQHLKEAVEAHEAQSGVALVYEPSTGNIVAMANWPAPDPELGKPIAGFNPNYSQVFEPGSTFKILTLAHALDRGKASLDEVIQCNGVYHFGKSYRVRCDSHHGVRGHGPVDAEKAIAKSCNIAAAQWALRLGYDDMTGYLKDLGLLNSSGIGVPKSVDVAGQFNFDEYAKRQQIANVGFGQAISCAPIALASAFASLGNKGMRMQPRLIQQIGDKVTPIKKLGQVVTPGTADTVLGLMESVISSDIGTGKSLRIEGYRLAGKTGTAQKIGWGEGHVASFVGFVPAVNPKAMVLVMIDSPKNGYYGAEAAGPVFKQTAIDLIRMYKIAPEAGGPAQK
ncbi:MAG: penicillin-binding protein 2 [Armatimonadetes bacterium]|nr:penicillin-binding protein 2 [Armatimonadota bacterium]